MPGRPRLQRGVQHVPQAEKTQFRQFVADAFDGKVDVHAGRAGKSRQLHAFAEAQGFEAGIAAAGGGAGFGFDEGVAKAGDQFPRQRIPLEQPEERAQRNVSVEFIRRSPANGASDESVPSECSRMASMILSYLWQAPQVVGPLFWAVWHSMQFLW